MIKIIYFSILTTVKSGYFFLRGYLGIMTWVMSPSTLNFLYWVFSVSWPESRVWWANPIDLNFIFNWFFFIIPSFNIVFYLELDFMIFLFSFFIMLFRPHNPGIVFNRLIRIDLVYFLSFFFIKTFANFISQRWVWHSDWKLSFIICFNLLSMRLSQSHGQNHEFGRLTQVKSSFLLLLFSFY